MGASTFLVVELPHVDEVMARFTAAHPGATVDIIAEPVESDGGEMVQPCVCLVRNGPPMAVKTLVRRLASTYGPPRTVRRAEDDGVWVGKVRIPNAAVHDPGMKAILRFRNRIGVPWSHLEDGVLYLRAKVQDNEDPEKLRAQVARYFHASEVEAQVSLEEVSSHDYGVWRDLVEYAVGLN